MTLDLDPAKFVIILAYNAQVPQKVNAFLALTLFQQREPFRIRNAFAQISISMISKVKFVRIVRLPVTLVR